MCTVCTACAVRTVCTKCTTCPLCSGCVFFEHTWNTHRTYAQRKRSPSAHPEYASSAHLCTHCAAGKILVFPFARTPRTEPMHTLRITPRRRYRGKCGKEMMRLFDIVWQLLIECTDFMVYDWFKIANWSFGIDSNTMFCIFWNFQISANIATLDPYVLHEYFYKYRRTPLDIFKHVKLWNFENFETFQIPNLRTFAFLESWILIVNLCMFYILENRLSH